MNNFFTLMLIFGSTYAFSQQVEHRIDIKRTTSPRQSNLHYPIIGDRAASVGHLKLNFDKMPGGQATDPVSINALSVGLGERLELGILPWVYMIDSDGFFKYGVTLKYNFYKTKSLQMAFGGSQIKGLFRDRSITKDENMEAEFRTKLEQWYNYLFGSINYTPAGKRFNAGINFKYTEIIQRVGVSGYTKQKILESTLTTPYLTTDSKNTFHSTVSFDLNYNLKPHHWIGLALGTASIQSKLNIEEDEYSPEDAANSKPSSIVGLSYILRKQIGPILDPRISMVYFQNNGLQFGLSMSI